MTLRRKLIWLVTLLVILLLLANLVLVRYEYSQVLAKNFDGRMIAIGSSVSLMILPSLVAGGGSLDMKLAEVDSLLRKMIEEQDDIVEISIFDAAMRPLQSNINQTSAVSPENRIEKILPIRIRQNGQVYGFVKVIFNLAPHAEQQFRLLSRLVILGIAFSLLGLIASFFMARAITSPLEKLRDGAIEFGRKNYDVRVQAGTADEIGVLADTFNDMAGSIQRQIGRILQLQEWSQKIAGELDRSRVIDTVVKAFIELGGISKFSLMFLDESSGQLAIVAGVGLSPEAHKMRLAVGEGIAGRVMESGKVMRVEKIADSPEYKSLSGETRRGTLVAIPLVAKGRCFGVINLHEKTDGTTFDSSDESILTTLAEIASVAFENARLYDLAITDGLTKLFIVRYFHQRIAEEITRTHRTSRPLSLIMADIDHFKSINDTYGHQTGDAVLVTLAQITKRVFREIDIPCRYGGEEFSIILPDTDMNGSMIVGERFRTAVEKFKFSTPAGELSVTISIGISTYTLGRSKDELIHEADSALYVSKRKGRNAVTHYTNVT